MTPSENRLLPCDLWPPRAASFSQEKGDNWRGCRAPFSRGQTTAAATVMLSLGAPPRHALRLPLGSGPITSSRSVTSTGTSPLTPGSALHGCRSLSSASETAHLHQEEALAQPLTAMSASQDPGRPQKDSRHPSGHTLSPPVSRPFPWRTVATTGPRAPAGLWQHAPTLPCVWSTSLPAWPWTRAAHGVDCVGCPLGQLCFLGTVWQPTAGSATAPGPGGHRLNELHPRGPESRERVPTADVQQKSRDRDVRGRKDQGRPGDLPRRQSSRTPTGHRFESTGAQALV